MGSPLTGLLTFSVTMRQYKRMHPRPNLISGRNTIVYIITLAGGAMAGYASSISNKDTETNLSDLFTKFLMRPSRELLLGSFTY